MNSFNSRILKEIKAKQSHLCVGLDINPDNFDNPNLSIDDLKAHTNKVIDATRDIAIAYKPNLAFFESQEDHAEIYFDFNDIGQDSLMIDFITKEISLLSLLFSFL